MVNLTPHADGTLLAVRAQPGARKNAVGGEHGGALKVAVTAPPEDGRANTAIVELLREWLGLKRSEVELATGLTNRNKQVLIRGRSPEEVTALLAARLG
ncbi:YggU family protein [bacterium]|nr:YggU family protein [bacterium]